MLKNYKSFQRYGIKYVAIKLANDNIKRNEENLISEF